MQRMQFKHMKCVRLDEKGHYPQKKHNCTKAESCLKKAHYINFTQSYIWKLSPVSLLRRARLRIFRRSFALSFVAFEMTGIPSSAG